MAMPEVLPDDSMMRPYRPPLRRVLETLGSDVLYAVHVPNVKAITVGEPVVYDPDDPLEERPGCVLLAVGSRATSPATRDLVGQAARFAYHAIVVKDRGSDLAPLIDAAKAARIALLIAPQQIPWRQLDALLTAAVSGPGVVTTAYSSVSMGDLFALANAIAATIGGATCLEDPQGNVLSYSNIPGQEIDEIRRLGILGRRTPQRPTNRTEYSLVFKANGPILFPSLGPGHTPRLATAVRAGTRLLGFIWVLDGTPPARPDGLQLLEEAARITALHLLSARNPSDLRRWHRSETLRTLLEGATSGSAAAARLGVPSDSPVTVLAFAPLGPAPEPDTAIAGVLDLVSLCCEAWYPHAVCSTGWGSVYALLPVPADISTSQLVRVATDVVTTVRKSARLSLSAGIGPVVEGLSEVPFSKRLAERIIRVLAETTGASVAVATDERVRARLALHDLAERGDAAIEQILEPVRRIFEHDRVHSTTHGITLLAYLDSFGEVSRAAAELSVHENTLRYRLRRLQVLYGIDLNNPAERLMIWLHLSLLRLKGEL